MLSVVFICISIMITVFILFFSLGIGVCVDLNADKKTATLKVKVFGKITAVKFKFYLLDKELYYRLNSKSLKKISKKKEDKDKGKDEHSESKAKNAPKTSGNAVAELSIGEKLNTARNAFKSTITISKCSIDVVSPTSPANCMTLAVISMLLQSLNNNKYIHFNNFSAITFSSADKELRVYIDILVKWEIFKIAYVALKLLFGLSKQVKKETKARQFKAKKVFP